MNIAYGSLDIHDSALTILAIHKHSSLLDGSTRDENEALKQQDLGKCYKTIYIVFYEFS